MKVPRYFPVLAALTLLFALHAGAQGPPVHPQPAPAGASTPHQPTPEQIAKMPVRALPIKDFKLLNSGTGWASTGDRLLLTTDNGAHWKDISPPNPNQDNYASVDFLDADTGWVLLVGHPREGECADEEPSERDWAFHVASTVDGGKTWTETHVKMPSCDSGSVGPSLNDNGNLTFADKLHGWLMLEHQSGSAFSFGSLFTTTDGGRTWHESNENPDFYGDIRAYPNGDLWVSGGAGGDNELAVSHEGRGGFKDVSLPAPKVIAPFDNPEYGLPVFTDSLHGYETVSYSTFKDSKSVLVLFESGNGGRTWKPDRILSNLYDRELISPIVVGSTWIVPFAPKGSEPTLMRLLANERRAAADHKLGDLTQCSLSFITSEVGWMNSHSGLSSTIDGGATWTSIAPRTRNGVLTTDPVTPLPPQKPLKTIEIRPAAPKTVPTAANTSPRGGLGSGIDQYLGFDNSTLPTINQMQTWRDSSPFYDVGIYLPGAISALPNPNLDSGWVITVSSQGWGIIPIWSGPQPPCTVEKHKNHFSADPANDYEAAKNEGIEQAKKAYTSATALGLDGTIIYVDVENYYTAQCGAAAEKYMNGWVQEMHTLGGSGSGGVYGAIGDADDIKASGADDIYAPRSDGAVTVWHMNHNAKLGKPDLSNNLSDDLGWTNKQRIHQYETDTWHIWGGVSLHIDSDIVDARVVPALGLNVRYPIFQAPMEADAGGLAGINNGVNISGNPRRPAPANAGLLRGTFVGPYLQVSGLSGAFIDSPTAGYASLNALSGQNVVVAGINNLGQVVGSDDTGGFLYTRGGNPPIMPIYGPNEGWAQPTSINDAGWILALTGDVNNIGICEIIKPPYTTASTVYFYSIGNIPCAYPTTYQAGEVYTWLNNWGDALLGINGLGQIAGSSSSELVGSSEGVLRLGTQVFMDDVESGVPGPSDNLAILATTQGIDALIAAGINNNGQIAGTYSSDYSWGDGGDVGFFINTDGSYLTFPIVSADSAGIVLGVNDDVQMVGTDVSDWVGFFVDTRH